MDFQQVVDDLVSGRIRTGLNPRQQKLFPRFAYHFTDILNAVSILEMGEVVTRKFAKAHQIMGNDNASREVINGTPDDVSNFVRLYFHPKTPTQFYNEGFQVKASQQRYEANCPVPVFFLFDLPKLLNQPGVQFTARSLAGHTMVPRYKTPEEFRSLPFDKIFHDRPILPPESRDDIVPFRQAEIIVPESLNLKNLRHILVRSIAEKETLVNLLHDKKVYNFDDLIKVRGELYFFMDRNFIDDVELTKSRVIIKSNVNNSFPAVWGKANDNVRAKFALNSAASENFLQVTVERIESNGQVMKWPAEGRQALLINEIRLGIKETTGRYTLRIYIDGHIAYEGFYQQADDFDLPF